MPVRPDGRAEGDRDGGEQREEVLVVSESVEAGAVPVF